MVKSNSTSQEKQTNMQNKLMEKFEVLITIQKNEKQIVEENLETQFNEYLMKMIEALENQKKNIFSELNSYAKQKHLESKLQKLNNVIFSRDENLNSLCEKVGIILF